MKKLRDMTEEWGPKIAEAMKRAEALENALAWALGLIREKTDRALSSYWYCPHCDGRGTGLLSDPVEHKPNCPWVEATLLVRGKGA